jgi:iron(III) transport system permease protein
MPPRVTRFAGAAADWALFALAGAAAAGSLDATARHLARNTVVLVLLTLLVSLPLGTLLALLLERSDLPGRGLWRTLLAMQLFVPLYVQAAAWDAGFGVMGWFTALVGPETVVLQQMRGAAWVHGVTALPWVVLIVGAGLRCVEPELEEEALLSASQPRVLWHVTLRRALPAVGVAGIWVAVTTAGEMTATDLFRVRTFAEEIYDPQAHDAGAAQTLFVIAPLVAAVVLLVLSAVPLCAQLAPPPRQSGARRRLSFELGQWRKPLAALVGATVLGLVAVPLGSLCFKAGHVDGDALRIWSPRKLAAMVFSAPSRFADECGWTVQMALLTAGAAVVAGLLLAWTARRSQACAAPVLGGVAVLLALPGPLIGLGLIWLLNRRDLDMLVWLYDRTLVAPWLALLLRSLPWTVLILWFALRSIPLELIETAAVDGAGPIARLLRVGLPLRLGAAALAGLVAVAVSLADLAATILVLPPGVDTLSIRIFQLIHSANDDQVAGICLALLAMIAAMTALWTLLARWIWKH